LFEETFVVAACERRRGCSDGGKTSAQAAAEALFKTEERNFRRFMVIPSMIGKGLGSGRSLAVL
jgi:hypothetical protein